MPSQWFLPDYPFIFSFGCAISLYKIEAETRITRPFRFVSQSGFSLFSFCLLFPHFSCRIKAATPIRPHPFANSSSYGLSHAAAYTLTACTVYHPRRFKSWDMVLFTARSSSSNASRVETNSCPLTAPSVFIIPLTSCQLFFLFFFVTAFYWSRHIVFRCKVSMQPGATHGLDQWRNSTNLPLSSLRFGRTPK